jgi:N-methylhydantoinase B
MTTAFQIRGSDMMSGTGSNSAADVPPRGVGGGMPGAATEYKVLSDNGLEEHVAKGAMPAPDTIGGRAHQIPANTPLTVVEGDLFLVTNGGGGGLGDPLLRDPAVVLRDVDDGYVDPRVARDVYGVVSGQDGAPDVEATREQRASLRESRIGARPARDPLSVEQLEIGISVRAEDGHWACGYCAADLGVTSGNYRSACAERRRPIVEVFGELGMKVRDRASGPVVELSEYFCPECASCVRSDVGLEGSALAPAPELARSNAPGATV